MAHPGYPAQSPTMLRTAVEAHPSGVLDQNDAQNELCVPVVTLQGRSYRIHERQQRINKTDVAAPKPSAKVPQVASH